MLSLTADSSNNEEHKPPKYIQLSLGHNVIGRGYKSNFKLLNYPWLSRKHLTITKVDSPHFLESFGKTGVFVNEKKANFRSLREGDRIIIGGGSNDIPVDGKFPVSPGPYIEYSYSYNTKVEDKENIYKDPVCNADDLIAYEEQINGRIVKETYHMQDFDTTLDNFDIATTQTVLPLKTEKVAESNETNMPSNRPIRNRKPRKDLDMVYNDPKRPKRRLSSQSVASGVSDTSIKDKVNSKESKIKPCSSTMASGNGIPNAVSSKESLSKLQTSSLASNKMDNCFPEENVQAAKSSLTYGSIDNMDDSSKSSSDSVSTRRSSSSLGSVKWQYDSSIGSVSTSSLSSLSTTTNRSSIESNDGKTIDELTTQNMINQLKNGIKKRHTKGKSKKSVAASATITKAEAEMSQRKGLVTGELEEDKDWEAFTRTAALVDKTVALMDKKIAERDRLPGTNAENDQGPSTSTLSSSDINGTSDKMVTSDQKVKKLKLRSPSKSPLKGRRPKRLSKATDVKYSDWSGSDDSEINSRGCTPIKGIKRKSRFEKEYMPEEDTGGELPDIDAVNCSNVDELVESEKRGKRKSDQSNDGWPPNKKAKTAKKGKSKKPMQKPRLPQQQVLLDQWRRRHKKVASTNWVEVLNGNYKRILYGFANKSIFQVTYKNKEEIECDKTAVVQYWDSDEYDVIVNINMPLLEENLLAGTLCEDDKTRVFRLVKKQMKRAQMKDYDKARMLPNEYSMQQPEEIKLELKQYQLNALSWMKKLEDRVDRGFTSTKLVEWEKSGLELGFDVVNKRVFVPPLPISSNTVLTVKSKGGILADQMGLGKTITLLSLIAKNKATFSRIPDPKIFDYQEMCSLPTGATLVVAPSHLTGQWKDEVESHTEGLKVLIITTKPQYEKLTYVDILEADIVVVSVQFLLTNKVFTALPTGVDCETSFMQLMRKSGVNPLLQNAPNLMHFKWWRIIADEAHEIMTYDQRHIKSGRGKNNQNDGSQGLQALSVFPSYYRWYVTGTPFPHAGKSLRAALKFLEVTVDDPKLEYPDGSLQIDKFESVNEDYNDQGLFLYPLHNVVYNHLYVRNTKGSIGLDYDVPEYIEELILLTMGDIERGIYDRSISELERRQLCCHLQIAARIQNVAGVQQKTLDEVRVALVAQTRKDIDRTQKGTVDCEKDLKEAKSEKHKEFDPRKKTLIQGRITRLQDTLKRYAEEMTKHESALSYFDSIVPRINHDVDEPCVICLETIERLTVTPCGHLYCRKCILQCLQAQGQCPTCRKVVRENQLLEVQDAKGRNELAKSAELKKLTETYGTKMAYLIFYLRNLFNAQGDSRVIIFSQWDSLLHKIGETLCENNITNVFVKGNVHVRNKAIMSFRKQEKTRVIMLSLANAASGTNLVEATHVVLIDPVAGSPEEAIAIDSQAIGRAHRMGQDKQISVVRMIMKDTIEHELYKRNSAEDGNIQQVDFDFENEGIVGGPQISRRTCSVPEPDPAVLQAALKKQQDLEGAASGSSLFSRGRGGRGGRSYLVPNDMESFERIQTLLYSDHAGESYYNSGNDSDELGYNSFDDDDDDDDDRYYGRVRRRNDCTVS